MKTYLAIVALLIAANVFAQKEDVRARDEERRIAQFEKDQDSLIEAVNIKWFVDSVSIAAKVAATNRAIADPERYGLFSDLKPKEFVEEMIQKLVSELREMEFYRNERNMKIRAAYIKYTQK